MKEFINTMIEGAIGGLTFGAYHLYVLKEIIDLNKHSADKQHKIDIENIERQHKTDIEMLEKKIIENRRWW